MDIYIADINDYTDCMQAAFPLLPADRQQRIRRAPSPEKKLQNLCTGLLLRALAGEMPILRGEHGKPYLENGPHFSLSHGGTLAVLAVSDEPVGVDVERPRPVKDALVRRCVRPEEQGWLAGESSKGFFWLWTRKEAVLKCCGRGLSLSPTAFSVLDSAVPVDGMVCRLYTQLWDGHILSAASPADPCPRLISVSPESLL